MFPFKATVFTCLITLVVCGFSVHCEPRVGKKVKRRTYSATFWSIGLSGMEWSEPIFLRQGTLTDKGMINYSGLSLMVDVRHLRRRWGYGAQAGVSSGKATSGLYSGTLEFEDGRSRRWLAAYAQPSMGYALHRSLMLSAGALCFWRQGDWTPADPSLEATLGPAFVVAPQLSLRVDVYPSVGLMQTLAIIGRNQTLWSFGIQYNFYR